MHNGKNWRYIVGYQVNGETIIPLTVYQETKEHILLWRVSIQQERNSYNVIQCF